MFAVIHSSVYGFLNLCGYICDDYFIYRPKYRDLRPEVYINHDIGLEQELHKK